MGRHRNAAAHMNHNAPRLLIGLPQKLCRFPGDGLLVEGMKEALPLHTLEPSHMGHRGHFIHTNRIHKERGNACHISQLPGQEHTQVGGMLSIGRIQHIGNGLVGHRIGPGGNVPQQASPAANRVKIRHLVTSLLHRLQYELLPEGTLINHMGKRSEIRRLMDQICLKNFTLFLKD